MSLPEPFVVTNRKHKCRQCGIDNSSLRQQAHKYALVNRYGTALVCGKCKGSSKQVLHFLRSMHISSPILSKKGGVPQEYRVLPVNLIFLRLMEELNPEPFDRRKF